MENLAYGGSHTECIPLTEVWSGCQPRLNGWIVSAPASLQDSWSFPQASHLGWFQELCFCSDITSRFKAGGREGDWTNHTFAYIKKSKAFMDSFLPFYWSELCQTVTSSRKGVLKAYVLMWQMHCYPEQDWHPVYKEENNVIGRSAHSGCSLQFSLFANKYHRNFTSIKNNLMN